MEPIHPVRTASITQSIINVSSSLLSWRESYHISDEGALNISRQGLKTYKDPVKMCVCLCHYCFHGTKDMAVNPASCPQFLIHCFVSSQPCGVITPAFRYLLWGSSAATPCGFYHKLTACPSYSKKPPAKAGGSEKRNLLPNHSIPNANVGLDILGGGWVTFDLLAQGGHKNAQRRNIGGKGGSPYFFQDIIMR